MNNYYKDSFNEVQHYVSLIEETRQWRKHAHEHVNESTNDIIKNIDNAETAIKNDIQKTESNLITAIDSAQANTVKEINQAETTIKAEIDSVQSQQQYDSSIITNIWNKIKNWNN